MREPLHIDRTGRETITRSSILSMEAHLLLSFSLWFLAPFAGFVIYLNLKGCQPWEYGLLLFFAPWAAVSIWRVCHNKGDMVEAVELDYDKRVVTISYGKFLRGRYKLDIPFDRFLWFFQNGSRGFNDRYLFFDENDEKVTWVSHSLGWSADDSHRLISALQPFPHAHYDELHY